jgi:ribosomal-protein-alanine N-acetyltransferase
MTHSRPSSASTPLVALAERKDAPALRRLMAEGLSPFDVDSELDRSYARLWVVRKGPSEPLPVGFLLAWQVADEAHLIDLIVSPSERRRGLGRALLEALIQHAKAQKLRLVLLEVRRGNLAAQRLYADYGFEVVGERAAYYGDGEDALLLRLALTAC